MKMPDYIRALPDSFRKDSGSNNYKLLLLEERLVAGLREDIDAVQATLDIYAAKGKTLDLYGAVYGVSRGAATDEQYRYLIMKQVAQGMAACDYNSIVQTISAAFGVPTTSFRFKENADFCEVEVVDLPYTVMQNAGMTAEQMQGIIEGFLPAGVSLAPMNLEGTFEFSASADEYDETAGFGNADQTIGGYFGYLAS